jgi:hypothetical protein
MKELNQEVIEFNNSLSGDGAILFLLEIVFSEENTIRITNNNQNVEYDNKTWYATALKVGTIIDSTVGETAPQLEVQICNVDRLLNAYMSQYKGGTGTLVRLYIIMHKDGEAIATESDQLKVYEEFVITSATADAFWVTLRLGSPAVLSKRIPQDRYLKDYCPFKYKGVECGYSGPLASCKHNISDCRAHNNSSRFGGEVIIFGDPLYSSVQL